jgi:hypothetical protein
MIRECKSCHEEKDISKGATLDHDHLTGNARGVLCRLCNAAIGQLGDSEINLQKAINYLKKWNKNA